MNAPRLRFSGFDNNWERVYLGDISSVTKLAGFEFTKYVTYSNSGNIIALRGLNVKKGLINLSDVKYIDGSDFTKLTRSKLYKNDLLFTYVGTIGEAAIVDVDDKYYLAPNVCLIRPSQVESAEFLLEYILNENFKRKIIDPLVTTSSQPSLSMENVRKFSINIPSIEEQKKISNFIAVINKKIQLQQEKIDLLKEQKKGYMQKIFSQELRFKDGEGKVYPKWSKVQLKTVAAIYDGTHQTPKYCNEGVKFLSVENIKDLKATKFISKEDYVKEFKIRPEYNNILMTRIGDIGTANIISDNEDYAYYVSLALIKCQLINPHYLLQEISNSHFQKELHKRTLHVAFPKKINMSEIGECIINLPDALEQEKIANFLSKFDIKIQHELEKIEFLKSQKQAFMQQLFI